MLGKRNEEKPQFEPIRPLLYSAKFVNYTKWLGGPNSLTEPNIIGQNLIN